MRTDFPDIKKGNTDINLINKIALKHRISDKKTIHIQNLE